MSKNTEVKFYIKVIITDSNKRGSKITIEANSIPDYIILRDILINDKIYTDENKLLTMKKRHNEALEKVVGDLFKEAYFQMTSCDKAVAKAVKPLLEEITNQKLINIERDKESLKLKNESDNRIRRLEKEKLESDIRIRRLEEALFKK